MVTDTQEEFARIREALEAADDTLVRALDERTRAVKRLVSLRERDPDGYYALRRNVEVVSRAREHASDFPADSIEPVFREVLAACDTIAGPRAATYVGPEGGFGHVAARRHFGAPTTLRAVDGVADVLEEVARGRASFGLVPLETSAEGAITATLHGLAESDVKICAERTVPSSYHLFSSGGDATRVAEIHGTAPAIAACERNLRTHFPGVEVVDIPTGEAAARATRESDRVAVLGTEIVGELYDLRPVRERMEDVAGIELRFAVVGNDLPPRTGADRTVLAMAVHDTPGALYQALQPFANRGINLTSLESRPAIGKPWKYLFFVEMDGHVTERPVLTAIDELRDLSRFVKILGSHPRTS